jgi:hypothetical protein
VSAFRSNCLVGLVITNFHVIDGASKVTVILQSDEPESAKSFVSPGYIVVSPLFDLAVLKIDKLDQPCAIKLAPALPKVGEKVAALGNPEGLPISATDGVVSGIRTGKQIGESIIPGLYAALGYSVEATWIQTSTPISHGNSGGPLLNMNAELVGLNTWSHIEGQNLNFAIALPDIERILKERAASAPPHSFAQLPRRKIPRTIPSDSPGRGPKEKYQITLPNGRVFSFEIFDVNRFGFNKAADTNRGDIVSIKHANGNTFAVAGQKAGLLHGVTIGLWENKEPMVYASYLAGKRHGVLMTYNEAGKPALFGQYNEGKRHGFFCLFDEGEFRLLTLHQNDKLEWVQLINGDVPGEGFSNRAGADKNEQARVLLAKQEALEASLKTNELKFRKFVREFELSRRRALAGQVNAVKRQQAQERENRRKAADNAVHDALYRNFLGR